MTQDITQGATFVFLVMVVPSITAYNINPNCISGIFLGNAKFRETE